MLSRKYPLWVAALALFADGAFESAWLAANGGLRYAARPHFEVASFFLETAQFLRQVACLPSVRHFAELL